MTGADKQQHTIMLAIIGDGHKLPTCVIFRRKTLPQQISASNYCKNDYQISFHFCNDSLHVIPKIHAKTIVHNQRCSPKQWARLPTPNYADPITHHACIHPTLCFVHTHEHHSVTRQLSSILSYCEHHSGTLVCTSSCADNYTLPSFPSTVVFVRI